MFEEDEYFEDEWRDEWRPLPPPPGYTWETLDLGADGVYWHLYFRGERVNGGLALNDAHAVHEARGHIWQHGMAGMALVRESPAIPMTRSYRARLAEEEHRFRRERAERG